MRESDIAAVIAMERASYPFPWSEGIFRDCLRVGYICRVIDIDDLVVGHAILSLGAGEAHILNVCIAEAYRNRGIGRHLLAYLLERAQASGMAEAFLSNC